MKFKRKNRIFKWLKRFVWVLFFIFLALNIFIWISGRTYIYKGVKETYLSGKSGPGIYDSLVFPVRSANPDKQSVPWIVSSNQKTLNQEEVKKLNDINTTSFLIIQDNEIILEKYFGSHDANTKSNSFSAAKSFIGLSIGIAVDHGFIKSLDDTITNYLPFSMKGAGNITIRHLLAMSSDINWSESGSNPLSDNAWAYYGSDLSHVIQRVSFGKRPGTEFEYASGNSQLLGFILQEATGLTPTAFVEKYIWSKLGTESRLSWSLDSDDGMEKAFCCIYATTRDYARFGQLILNEGEYKNEQIISNAMMKELSKPLLNDTPQYGLHFWILNNPENPTVYARGILGQYIIAIPSMNMVIVRTGHERKEKYPMKKNDYRSLHPKDLFTYISIAKRVALKSNN